LRLIKIGISAVLAGLILAGCGSDQYAIEKQYWQVQKQAEKIFRNPHASPPKELERVVNILSNYIKKYPNNSLATEADFNIARLYIAKEEYDKARIHLNSIIRKYKESRATCAEAVFLIGNSYQVQDKWDLALAQYKSIMQDYPLTIRGLNTPIYIAQYYKIKYQPDRMVNAYREAVDYYKALSDKYAGSPLAFNADTLVAQCYMAVKDWQDALNTFNAMLEAYKGKVSLDTIMMDMALIYNKEIKDKVKAGEILQKLIKEYPKSRLIKTATAILKELEKNE